MKRSHLVTMSVLVAGTLILLIVLRSGGMSTVTPAEAEALMQNRDSVLVLDVRSPEEYAGPAGHIAGAVLIPLKELEHRYIVQWNQEHRPVVYGGGN